MNTGDTVLFGADRTLDYSGCRFFWKSCCCDCNEKISSGRVIINYNNITYDKFIHVLCDECFRFEWLATKIL